MKIAFQSFEAQNQDLMEFVAILHLDRILEKNS